MLYKGQRVLYITYYYPPEIGAGSLRAKEITAALSEEYKVDVVTNTPNYPNSKLYSSVTTQENDLSLNEKGIFVHRIGNLRGATLLIRSLAYLWFVFACLAKSLRLLLSSRFEYIVTTSPPINVLTIGLILSLFTRTKWILEVRDLWPDIISELGKLPSTSFLYQLLVNIEKTAYRRCERIITVTEGFKKYLIEQKGVPEDKIFVVLNGTDLKEPCEQRFTDEELKKLKTLLSIKEENICGYLGTIGYAQGLEVVVEMASKCPEWHFIFCGDGAEKERLLQMSRDISNVTFLPSNNDKDYLGRLYSLIDVGIVSLRNTPSLNLTIPSKVYELVARDIPVLLMNCPEAEKLLGGGNVCNVSINEIVDIKEIKSVLNKLKLKHSSSRRSFKSEFHWNNLGKKYLSILRK